MAVDNALLTTFCRVAEEAARAAGSVALHGFRGPMSVRSKGGKDIVTEYDTAAEEAALAIIHARFPEHSILAEESGASGWTAAPGDGDKAAQWLWTVDPIDGTHNYAAQLPFWCVSVAVVGADGNAVAGVVFDPLHDAVVTAMLVGGAFLNGSPLSVSSTARL